MQPSTLSRENNQGAIKSVVIAKDFTEEFLHEKRFSACLLACLLQLRLGRPV